MASFDDLPDPSWYLDTGASNHVTPDLSALSLQAPYNGPSEVCIGNDQNLTVTNKGSSILPTPIHTFSLRNILHVPSLSTNLLSVKKFVADNNCSLTFDKTHFVIQDKVTNIVLHHGLSKNGLYPIQACSSQPCSDLASLFAASSIAPLWHNRLGHPDLHSLNIVFQNFLLHNKLSHLHCNNCMVAKCHQLPLQISITISSSPLELIHLNVWGLLLNCLYLVFVIIC